MAEENQLANITDFVLGDIKMPKSAMQMAARLLVDTLSVAAGSAMLEPGKIAREFAFQNMAAGNAKSSARMMFDGRSASMVGAAFALASQIDNLDGHDGFNPTKGHIGCAVVPALLAFGEQLPHLTSFNALKAMVISYEIAARAAMALHESVTDYHTSGAWNGLGVAAMGCNLFDYNRDVLRQALGIAEYHGPRSQMMREIDNPSMLHDGSGMGALVGIKACLMAAKGFKGAPAITVEAIDIAHHWQDLGLRWTIEENYIKPYPICRWAHAAIDATRKVMMDEKLKLEDIHGVNVTTFHEASRLFSSMPEETSQAQYSLPFALAVFMLHGCIAPHHISGEGLHDDKIRDILPIITVEEDEKFNARFPMGRWASVSIITRDGRKIDSGEVHARGGPEFPMNEVEFEEKFRAMTNGVLERERADKIMQNGLALADENSPFSQFSKLLYSPCEYA